MYACDAHSPETAACRANICQHVSIRATTMDADGVFRFDWRIEQPADVQGQTAPIHFTEALHVNDGDGPAVQPPVQVPKGDLTWSLYDTSEAQEMNKKGIEWLKDTEKAVATEHGLDLAVCQSVVTLLKIAVSDIRMQYMQADMEQRDSRKLRTKVGTHLDKLKDLQSIATRPEDKDHITFCHTHLASIMNNIDGRGVDNCDTQQKMKEHMFVLQQRVGGLAALSQLPACSICLCDPITTVAIPCGHTYCSACSAKMKEDSNKCYICRSLVSFVNELHIS